MNAFEGYLIFQVFKIIPFSTNNGGILKSIYCPSPTTEVSCILKHMARKRVHTQITFLDQTAHNIKELKRQPTLELNFGWDPFLQLLNILNNLAKKYNLSLSDFSSIEF